MTTSGLQENGQEFIPGVFDVARLMAAAAAQPGQREALLALMDKVCGSARSDLDGAFDAWRAGQRQEAASLIHGLRGSIGTLGASVFSATSRELESAVREGRAADPLFGRASGELQATIDAALAWLARQPRMPAGSDAGNEAANHAAIARWKTLLAERDIDAVTQYQQVRPALAALGATRAAAIEQAMARLDFAAVLNVLGERP